MDFGVDNGALVNYLDQYYTSYKGFDISKKQIENANKFFSDFENVSFMRKTLKKNLIHQKSLILYTALGCFII